MNVLLVTPSYHPILGGSEALTETLSVKLNEIGFHADIMTLNMNTKWKPTWREKTEKDGPVHVFRMGAFNLFRSLPNPLYIIFRVNVIPKPSFTKKLRNYDIIHFIGEADLGFPLSSYFVQKPKIMHWVGIFKNGGIYWYYMFKRPFLRTILKRILSNIAKVHLISSTQEEKLLADLGIPINKIVILPMGVDVKTFRPVETKKVDNLVLFVGRIERIKGLHLLLDALPYLDTPVRLAIVGPRWDEEYVKEIEQECHNTNENGVHEVELVGALDQNGLLPWYQKAAIVVCPYLVETYSNVVREALACGTPVVSTGTKIVERSVDGILLAPKNPKGLADAIMKLLKDKEMREEYGREGRKLMEKFSWESIAEKLTNIYKDLLED